MPVKQSCGHLWDFCLPYRDLLLTNIGQLLTLAGSNRPRRGAELNDLGIVEHTAVLCHDGKIAAVGSESELMRALQGPHVESFDCRNGVVVPGFVDSHTHPVFTSPRLVDFEKRIQGASYEQIAHAGGGIRSSVAGVRAATEEELASHVLLALGAMQRCGTTTVEAKSGYGLSPDSELKSLRAIQRASSQWEGTVVPTLLAAHVVPAEFAGRPDAYVDLICSEIIPETARAKLAEYVDVFCERGAFTVEQTERVFAAAQEHGLGVRAHVCQFTPAEVSRFSRFDPASFDHLDCIDDNNLNALATQDTVATLLPGASYFLGHAYPPARKLIEAGAAVALATDYNPGTSPTGSMPLVLSLACTQMRMSPAEAIAAATINGAHALRFADRKGSVELQKDADLAIFDFEDYRELCYWFGSTTCRGTVTNGRLEVF